MQPAFTMAEVLIVLGILGLVADMTIPTLITKVNNKALQTAKQVAALKFEEALNQMRVNEKLTGYNTADDFMNEFKNYIKIVQRCKPENITQCFPMTIETATEKIDPNDLKTGSDIVPPAKRANFPSNNVGITIPSGIMAILNYDKTCPWMNPLTGGSSNRQEAMTCISMVYDVNGRKKPNKVGEDIILLNAQLSSCDGVKLGSLCVETSNTPYTKINTCDGSSDKKWDEEGSKNQFCERNYWAGAKKACDDKDMRLPTMSELGEMAKLTYGLARAPRKEENLSGLIVKDPSLNLVGFNFWSSELYYNNENASVWIFVTDFTSGGSSGKSNSHPVRCVR